MNTIIDCDLTRIQTKALRDEALTKAEALAVLTLPDGRIESLLACVSVLREKYKGKRVSVHILTNAKSGGCTQDCAYCAQSRESRADISTYALVDYEVLYKDGLLGKANNAARHCIGFSGLTFSDAEIQRFCAHIARLGQSVDTDICCSIGFVTRRQAQWLKDAGVKRINHNLNAGRNFYSRICTSHSYEERLANIRMLQDTGFEICCGGIVGLGESPEDVVDMFSDVRDIAPESVPVNFLLPIRGTPLEGLNTQYLTPEYCLKVLCLARLMVPRADIRCAAGREVYLKDRQKQMFNAVDSVFARGYLTTGGECIEDTLRLIRDLGYEAAVE